MEVIMSELRETRGTVTTLISTAVEIAAGSRNKVSKPDQQMGHLTQSLGNMIVSSSTEVKTTYANILKVGISGNHTETSINKPVKESRNKDIICESWLRGYCIMLQVL